MDYINKFHRHMFKLQALKAVMKVFFSKSYCYTNPLCYENDNNMFMIGYFFDTMIIASSDKELL